jgi:predicted nucleotidyltransferase
MPSPCWRNSSTSMLDLEPRHRQIVKGILQLRVPSARVWAFGSRAKGLAKRFSDLDLAVEAGAPLDLQTLALIDEDFVDSDLPMKVDVVDLAAISPEFRAIVERDRVEV